MALKEMMRLLLATILISTALQAAEPPLARRSAGFDDAKLSLKVKSAIAADSELGGLNVFVSVLDGVVAVQGPVSTEAVKEKLRTLVTAVPGVASVKVDCFIVGVEDSLKKEVAKRMAPAAPKVEETSVEPKTAIPVATGALPSIAVGPPAVSTTVPTVDDLPPINGNNSTVTVQRPSESAELARPTLDGGLLAAPVSAKAATTTPRNNATTTSKPYPTIPPPNVPIVPVGVQGRSADEVAFALIDLRKSNPRFAGINATVENGVVTISGRADSEAVEAFLTAVRQMPGVLRADVR